MTLLDKQQPEIKYPSSDDQVPLQCPYCASPLTKTTEPHGDLTWVTWRCLGEGCGVRIVGDAATDEDAAVVVGELRL